MDGNESFRFSFAKYEPKFFVVIDLMVVGKANYDDIDVACHNFDFAASTSSRVRNVEDNSIIRFFMGAGT